MRLLFLLLFAVSLTGCTASSFLGAPVQPYQDVLDGAPPALVAFNKKALGRGLFAVVLTDSTRIKGVQEVALGVETTRYRQRGLTSKYVPTAQVARIETWDGGGFSEGARIGAAAGGTILGIGLVMAATERDPCADAGWICIPPSGVTMALGLAVGTVGSLGLGLVSSAFDRGEWSAVYHAGLHAYLLRREEPAPE